MCLKKAQKPKNNSRRKKKTKILKLNKTMTWTMNNIQIKNNIIGYVKRIKTS